ncbi:MAG TPA: hypothetical protein VFR31_00020 [Thermoanaerobaculia bacterium]|nr:hypothetical protein [Thermoanaerobaculia bacterium]
MRANSRKAATMLAVALAAVLSLSSLQAQQPESPAASWLKRLKSLEGEWKGTTPAGKPVKLSYKSIAGGSAVMEVFSFADKPDSISMYTIYHLDGEQLMLTHYCVSNNQPRMRAELPGSDPNVVRFAFVDATNLPKPEAGHMNRAMLKVIDENHIANEWTYKKDGKDAFTEGAQYERVR